MKLREQIQKDKKIWKSLSKEEKKLFLWDYYRIPLLAMCCLVVLGGLSMLLGGQKKEVALYAVFVNATPGEHNRPELLEQCLAEAGVDMTGKRVDIDAGLTLGVDPYQEGDGQTVQVLAALFGISGLDVYAADEQAFLRYAKQDAFLDLGLFLEPELLANGWQHTDSQGRTITAGLLLTDSPLHQAGYYTGPVIIGAAANAENLEAAVAFLTQLAKECAG